MTFNSSSQAPISGSISQGSISSPRFPLLRLPLTLPPSEGGRNGLILSVLHTQSAQSQICTVLLTVELHATQGITSLPELMLILLFLGFTQTCITEGKRSEEPLTSLPCIKRWTRGKLFFFLSAFADPYVNNGLLYEKFLTPCSRYCIIPD